MTTRPSTFQKLADFDERVSIDSRAVYAGECHRFVSIGRHDDAPMPECLPSIAGKDRNGNAVTYFLVPAETDLPSIPRDNLHTRIALESLNPDSIVIPESDDWPSDADIVRSMDEYREAVRSAKARSDAAELLSRERQSGAGLYASAARIDETTPMLVDGLMRERGVSVVFGDFDEFKTTLVLDLAAHIAAGAHWQGRTTKPFPVIWYALEGADEIPARLRALETNLRAKNTPWGNDRLPITVFDRIPECPRAWRAEISRTMERWENLYAARNALGELPTEAVNDRNGGTYESIRYPDFDITTGPGVVVIDTLSMALGGEDEKGPAAAGFIQNCLDLLKECPDMAAPLDDEEEKEKWKERHPGETAYMDAPVASHVIVIHHQTKTGTDFAGHRAIAANTQGLYRVHRFGKMTDAARPYAGQLTPLRVKGIPRPAPIRFEVGVVPVEGTKQTAAILKDKATAIPKRLFPIIEALRELDGTEEIGRDEVNACLDVASKGAGSAQRVARKRNRDELILAGVLEPVEDDNGKVAFYRFHDTVAV